jgi:hypothetical protein
MGTANPCHSYIPHIPHESMLLEEPVPDFFTDFGQDLVEQRALKTSGTTSIDFDGLLSRPLKLHEDLANGCGGQLWPAGMVLAKYMLRNHKDTLNGKTMFVRSAMWSVGVKSADSRFLELNLALVGASLGELYKPFCAESVPTCIQARSHAWLQFRVP